MGRWDGLNRRKFPRVNFPCLVVIRDGKADGEAILAHTENIGIGGICLILKKDVKMFSSVELELDLLDMGGHIKCAGKIVWNVKRKTSASTKPNFYDLGVEFQGLDKKALDRLQQIVVRLVRDNKEA